MSKIKMALALALLVAVPAVAYMQVPAIRGEIKHLTGIAPDTPSTNYGYLSVPYQSKGLMTAGPAPSADATAPKYRCHDNSYYIDQDGERGVKYFSGTYSSLEGYYYTGYDNSYVYAQVCGGRYNYQCTFGGTCDGYVEDGGGGDGSTDTNEAPNINDLEFKEKVKVGESVTISVDASDPDGDSLDYSWSNGDTGTSTTVSYTTTGVKEVEVQVSDGQDSVSSTANINVVHPDAPQPPNPVEKLRNWFEGVIEQITGFDIFSAATELPTVKTGETVSKDLTASDSIQSDTTYADGDVTYIYGKWSIVDKGKVVQESSWKKLQTSEFSHSFSRDFTSTGKKAYVVVLAKAHSEYNYDKGQWSDYQITTVDKAKYKFKVEGLVQPPSPVQKLVNFFQNFLEGIF